jgi:transcriptional regulator with XRE-family HTH domain
MASRNQIDFLKSLHPDSLERLQKIAEALSIKLYDFSKDASYILAKKLTVASSLGIEAAQGLTQYLLGEKEGDDNFLSFLVNVLLGCNSAIDYIYSCPEYAFKLPFLEGMEDKEERVFWLSIIGTLEARASQTPYTVYEKTVDYNPLKEEIAAGY